MLVICCPRGELKITLPRGVYTCLVELPIYDTSDARCDGERR